MAVYVVAPGATLTDVADEPSPQSKSTEVAPVYPARLPVTVTALPTVSDVTREAASKTGATSATVTPAVSSPISPFGPNRKASTTN